ncbi:unnamed protein product [Lactuca virosa]|uniref:RING-type E3 ubiquitin transferase n=1 Tax=Lactuca virosa TaxID=75947 RepID=A0AAU9M5Z6_9ASTR|nr:unnamed protein product [Lactuca virosa]
MHLLNEVSVRIRAFSEQLSRHQIVFEEALEGLKQFQTLNEQTKQEAKGLKEEVAGLAERNQSLVKDFSQALSGVSRCEAPDVGERCLNCHLERLTTYDGTEYSKLIDGSRSKG